MSDVICLPLQRLLLVFFVLCLLCSVPEARAETSDASARAPVKKIEISGLYSISNAELLDLLTLSVGKPLDRADLRTGIKRAFLKEIFDDIIVEGFENDTDIRVTVKEKAVIDSIKVTGNEYLSKSTVKSKLNISEGERLSSTRIGNSIKNMVNELKEKGFPALTAVFNIVPLKRNLVEIVIVVNEGQPEIIKKIKIARDDETVRSYLKLSEGDIFDMSAIDSLKARIRRYFRQEGYINTSLTYSFREGVLYIELDRGKKLDISFEGNTAIKTGVLMKEMPFFEINDFGDELIEETTARIISLYHKSGYPYAQAAPVITKSETSISLEFFIFEGDRFKVDYVTFDGMTTAKERFRDVLMLRAGSDYNPDALESDTETVTEIYRALGYLYMEMGEPEVRMSDNKAEIIFYIKEGPQVTISKLTMLGNEHISMDEIRKVMPVKEGSPYNEVDISESKRMILDLYSKHGFLDAALSVESEISGVSANIVFRVSEGPVTFFGKSVITGNERTKQLVIRRELVHKENEPLNPALFMEERQRLYRLGIFNDVDIELAEKVGDRRDVIYKFKEANAGALEFGIGYGEYEKLRGFVDISYKNLWGLNRQASFRTELSTLEQRFILSYYEPWFLNRELVFKSLLLRENRREENIDTRETLFRLRRDSFSAGVEKKLFENLKTEFYYDFSVVKTYDVKRDVVLSREDVGTLIISGLRPGLIYDTRDNPFEPRKGTLAGLSYKIASSVFFSETDFSKLIAYINKYRALSKRTVLAVSLRSGAAYGFGDTRELPIVERFFLGGRTTVRGYDQDTLGPKGKDGSPTGGNAFAMGNFELRTDVGKGFGLVTFVDSGNVWKKVENMNLGDLKYTAGLGLRYNTPVGPFRVDYGRKLNKESGESSGAIHFSLGHAF